VASIVNYIKILRKEGKRFAGKSSFWGNLKYYGKWNKSLNVRMDEIPWMTFGVIDHLEEKATKDMKVFEYGAGSSTLFWAKRVKKVYSVEHDTLWAKKVKDDLAKKGIANVELFLILPQPAEASAKVDYSDPYQYRADDNDWREYSFEQYVKKINDFEDNYFDVVVVDGRARPSCLVAASSKVKVGGLMILDNSERQYYLSRAGKLFSEWERKDFCGPVPGVMHFHQTTIFKRLK
jgi:hypothetical protein